MLNTSSQANLSFGNAEEISWLEKKKNLIKDLIGSD